MFKPYVKLGPTILVKEVWEMSLLPRDYFTIWSRGLVVVGWGVGGWGEGEVEEGWGVCVSFLVRVDSTSNHLFDVGPFVLEGGTRKIDDQDGMST